MVTLGVPQNDLERWLKDGQKVQVSAVAWSEFLTGPFLPEQLQLAEAIIQKIVPFGQAEATCAAKIYNDAGRKREKRLDCMIAATAIVSQASLATLNRQDFAIFRPIGLFLL